MATHVCPAWMGYFLLNPFRRLMENPDKILRPFISEGMIVLEPGCGMGYFTLPLARMVGQKGRVVAVDIQQKMLSALGRRAQRVGLSERIDLRLIGDEGMGLDDLSGEVDFVAALHVVHEISDQDAFFNEVWNVLKPMGKLLLIEPKGHVTQEQFQKYFTITKKVGFNPEDTPHKIGRRGVLLIKP